MLQIYLWNIIHTFLYQIAFLMGPLVQDSWYNILGQEEEYFGNLVTLFWILAFDFWIKTSVHLAFGLCIMF